MSRHQDQPTLFPNERPATRDSGPVTCLGITFENDETRHAHIRSIRFNVFGRSLTKATLFTENELCN